MSDPNVIKRRRRQPPHEELREIEVLIYSAEDLKNVKHLTKMRTYAEVYVDKSVDVARTRVDEHGGANPTWNEVLKIKYKRLSENDVMAAVNVDIYADSHLGLEKHVGSARVLLCNVLKGRDDSEMAENPIQCLTVQVWRESGRAQGWLNLWVPPTGRFLIRRESLSFSVREREEEKVEGWRRRCSRFKKLVVPRLVCMVMVATCNGYYVVLLCGY